ncbi:MAG: hypothetical protein WAN44_17985 [Propionibacteriaceae bacterium]
MPRFGLAAGVTASPDLAQQRVLTRRRLAAVASVTLRIPIAVTLAVAVLNVVLAAIGGLRLG